MIARDARREDYPAFVRLFPELAVPDRTPSEEHFDERIRPSAFFLVEGGEAIAYAWWAAMGDVARVFHVIVDPAARGRQVGRALMAEIARRARAAGCARWLLFVKPDNAPAIRLYERCGMRAAERSWAMQIAWRDVERLEADATSGTSLAEPADDARLEAAFDLPRGDAARFRREKRALVIVREGDGYAGFAAFDPAFPGANPFRVRRRGLARVLLEGMRPHALPEHDVVRVVVEEDEGLRDAILAAGGAVLLDVLKMAGPIAI